MTLQETKTPPHSYDSEMMVLGCMLTSLNSLNIAADALDEQDFYSSEHKIIFAALKKFHKNDKPADVYLVAEELKSQNQIQAIGGVTNLTTLAQYAGTSAYIEEYIEIVKNKALLRIAIQKAHELEKQALNDPPDARKLLMDFQDDLRLVEKSGSKKNIEIKFLNEFDDDFLVVEPPKKPMLLDYAPQGQPPKGLLPKGIVAMLVGAGGAGKTHLLAQLAISIATGKPFLSICRPTEHCGKDYQGAVFLGLGENKFDDIHRVLHKAAKHIRQDRNLTAKASRKIAPYSFCGQQSAFIVDGKPSRYFREFKMRLQDSAPEDGWALIILDPVSRLLGADAEIDNAAATQFIALMEELTIDLPGNPTVLFAHHVNKTALLNPEEQSQTAARGASGLTDGVRLQLNFFKSNAKEQPEIAVLRMTKSNFTAIVEDIVTKKDLTGFIEYEQIAQQSINMKKNKTLVAMACKDTE